MEERLHIQSRRNVIPAVKFLCRERDSSPVEKSPVIRLPDGKIPVPGYDKSRRDDMISAPGLGRGYRSEKELSPVRGAGKCRQRLWRFHYKWCVLRERGGAPFPPANSFHPRTRQDAICCPRTSHRVKTRSYVDTAPGVGLWA